MGGLVAEVMGSPPAGGGETPLATPSGSDDDPDVELKIFPGHKTDMCIFASNTRDSKDRAQVLVVSNSMCTEVGETPRNICEVVVKCLEDWVCDDPKYDLGPLPAPIKGAAWLPEFRKMAREFRDMTLVYMAQQIEKKGASGEGPASTSSGSAPAAGTGVVG